MSDASAPHQHHSDDARADDAPPTDAISDEVKADSAAVPDETPADGDDADQS